MHRMGRRAAWILSMLLLASSCGGGSAKRSDGTVAYGGAQETTASSGSSAGSPSTEAGGGGSRPGGSSGDSSPATRPPGSGGSDRPTATTKANDPIVQASRSATGRFAPTVLGRRSPARRLVIDVLVQNGAEPRPASINRLRSVLGQQSGKPTALAGPTTIPGSGRRWTGAALVETAEQYATAVQGGDQAALRVLYVRGDLEGDRGVLGVALRGDVMVIFSDVVREASSPVVSAATIEDAVSMHELGHLLGLVDLVLNTGRQDPEHPGHSSSRDSVMYWAVEADVIGQVLGGDPPMNFDQDDVADLQTIRNGN